MSLSIHVCPWWLAQALDNPIRRIIHSPDKILGGYIEPGQTVLDLGCGSGTFTIAMARMVGEAGRVIAVDLQDEMLQLIRQKAVKEGLASRLGAEPLSTQKALDMLALALNASGSNVAIADFSWNTLSRMLPSANARRFESLRRHADEMTAGAESLEDFKLLIAGKSVEEVNQIVSHLVTQEVAQILAISPERIDPNRSLHDLGLDSLMGVELALGLEKRFGIQVPAMMLNEGPTVARVSARMIERLMQHGSDVPEEQGLVTTAMTLAAQHGQEASSEVVQAILLEVEQGGSRHD